MRQEVYSARLKLDGEENISTIRAANNCAASFNGLQRFEEAKSLLRKMMAVARRVFGESHDVMLKMRWNYGETLYKDPASTLDDLREAVTTLEDTARIARRVLGGAHPLVVEFERNLRDARAKLRARETSPLSSPSGDV